MKEVTINTVEEFLAGVNKIKAEQEARGNSTDLIFRGQPCDKPLLPKLGRVTVRGQLANIERLILEEFDRTSLPLREFEPKNIWDLLALAQHHGLPTRLLDWTYNALAALWFSVRNPPRRAPDGKRDELGVVWVLCPDTNDYGVQADDTSPLDNKSRTLVFRPKGISRRIVAQSAVFTIHKLIGGTHFVPLEKNNRYKAKLVKLIVPSKRFPSFRQELHIAGASASALFPDLDGLCTHLSWRYTKSTDEVTLRTAIRPRIRRRRSGKAS